MTDLNQKHKEGLDLLKQDDSTVTSKSVLEPVRAELI